VPGSRIANRPPLAIADLLVGCREAANSLGLDIDPIFTAHGIEPRLIDLPRGFIEKPKVLHALQDVADHYDCQHFGFLVGKHQPPLKFGAPAQLLKLAPSLLVALENIVRFAELTTQGLTFELAVGRRKTHFRRINTYVYDIAPTQLDLLGVVQSFKLFPGLLGRDWTPISVHIHHSAPSQKQELADFFGCPVLFDEPFTGIALNTVDLGRPIPTANEELLEIVQAYFTSQLPYQMHADDIVARTTDFVRNQLSTGTCNLESCAQQFGIHSRALQRALAEHGYTFKELILDTRMNLAREYLRHSQMPLTEVAGILGYENGSAFSRAFKRRHGMSPLQWRNDAKKEVDSPTQ
jgi:AraC-like DNA-binding protein